MFVKYTMCQIAVDAFHICGYVGVYNFADLNRCIIFLL
jgi:hypothetical protein